MKTKKTIKSKNAKETGFQDRIHKIKTLMEERNIKAKEYSHQVISAYKPKSGQSEEIRAKQLVHLMQQMMAPVNIKSEKKQRHKSTIRTAPCFNMRILPPYNSLTPELIHTVPATETYYGSDSEYPSTLWNSMVTGTHPDRGEISAGVVVGEFLGIKYKSTDSIFPFFWINRVRSSVGHILELPPISVPYALEVKVNVEVPSNTVIIGSGSSDFGVGGWMGILGDLELSIFSEEWREQRFRFLEKYRSVNVHSNHSDHNDVTLTLSLEIPASLSWVYINVLADIIALASGKDDGTGRIGVAGADYRSREITEPWSVFPFNVAQGGIKVKFIDVNICW